MTTSKLGDFSSSPNLRDLAIPFILAVILLVLVLIAGHRCLLLQEQVDEQRATLLRLQAHLAATAPAAPISLSAPVRQQLLSSIDRLNTPWSDIFDALERSVRPDITLISLTPVPRSKNTSPTINIVAESKNFDAAIGYLGTIREQRVFEFADLIKQEVVEQDVNHPLRVTFVARLRDTSFDKTSAGGGT